MGNESHSLGSALKYGVAFFAALAVFALISLLFYSQKDISAPVLTQKENPIPGEWVVTDIYKNSGIVHGLVVVDKVDIKRSEVEPTLRKALHNIKKEYPSFSRFWIWLVPDKRMTGGYAAGKLESDEGKVEIFNGIPPETAFVDPTWMEAGLIKLDSRSFNLAVEILAETNKLMESGFTGDFNTRISNKLGLNVEEVKRLKTALYYNYGPFVW